MVALAQVVGIPLSAYPFGTDSLPIRGPCVRPVGIGCRHRLSAYLPEASTPQAPVAWHTAIYMLGFHAGLIR